MTGNSRAGVLAAAIYLAGLATAEAQAPDVLFQAHLRAGEFAPAMALAQNAPDAQQHDTRLAQIAAAQARVGARRAALRSAAEIYDDRVRSQTLRQIAAEPLGGHGGGSQADFDSLIELITTTIAPTSWDEVGGPGSIAGFPTGVYVDPQGVLQPLMRNDHSGRLTALLASSFPAARPGDLRRSSPLRMISLPRLEKHVQLRLAAGRRPSEAMRMLAGLQRIEYVFVYPQSGDLVLAGPAGDWKIGKENRILGVDSGRPVLRLDDLVVVLRHMTSGHDANFGCAITPTQGALARAKAFLEQSQKGSIDAGRRRAWLERLRSQLGKQDIDVYGLDPRTRAARLIVEADYRMKLVGMGLEEGVPGVESYLDSIKVPRGQAPPPLGVLRWWFTLDYDAVLTCRERNAFAIRGQGVQVLSENERLAADGRRIHTGASEELNRRFARSFTRHFPALCDKYPVYAEMRNIFDLALVGALIRQEGLAEKVGWHMTCFGPDGGFPVELAEAPTKVETVINHRVINRVHIVAGVSGGVRVNPTPLVARDAIEIDRYGTLTKKRPAAVAKDLPPGAWWWD